MAFARLPQRALLRWYTVLVALVCGVAVTVIVHDVPDSRAAADRRAQAVTWKTELTTARARVAAAETSRSELRASYNRLVRTSHEREQRLLAVVKRWRHVAARH
jgi:hypothetical protein